MNMNMNTATGTSKQESPPRPLTIDEALEKLPFSGYHFLLVLMCGFAFMADAMEVSLLSFLPACAGEEWDLDRYQFHSTSSSMIIL